MRFSASKRLHNRVESETPVLDKLFALLATLAAAGCVFHDVLFHPIPLIHWMLLFALVPLLLIARALPLSASRERPLTFLAPLVFGLTLWLGGFMAGIAAWASCFLYARFGAPTGSSRNRARLNMRQQGTQFILAAYASALAMRLAGEPTSAYGINGVPLYRLMTAGMGALAFIGTLSVCYALANGRAVRVSIHSAAGRAHLSRLAFVMTLGVLPVVLLAPLGSVFSMSLGMPFLFLLLLSAHVARLHEEAGSLRSQLRVSEAMGQASVRDPDVVDGGVLLQRFLALAQELVPAERSLVWILDQTTGELIPEIALPDKGPFARKTALFGEGLIGHAAARMQPRLVMDAAADTRRTPREHASGAWLLYPIVVHEQLLGVAQWTRPVSNPFSSEDITRLESLVPQAAIALENVYIRAQVHDLAATDGLTGLWNHRRLHEVLRDELRRAVRYQRTLSILMMDVDSFKTFNDTYGHPQGDQLLRTVARILRYSVRNVDYVGRYGGEEFLIVLPETSKDDACRLAERIRAEIEEHAYVIVEGKAIRRTISIGVASYPEDALSPDELMKRADEALYRAKRSGKNRVIWA